MKHILMLIPILLLIGCSNNDVGNYISTNSITEENDYVTVKIDETITAEVNDYETVDSDDTRYVGVNDDVTVERNDDEDTDRDDRSSLSEDEVISLVESRMDQESLRVSSINIDGFDENGNYIVRQSSKATTMVMEWYYVNPITKEINCKVYGDNCLESNYTVDTENVTPELSSDKKEGLKLAKTFANNKLSDYGYVEDLTYVEFSHEEKGKLVFQVYNPGFGGTNTIDWVTVDLNEGVVVSKFGLDE